MNDNLFYDENGVIFVCFIIEFVCLIIEL